MRAGQIITLIFSILLFNFCDTAEPPVIPPPIISDTVSVSFSRITHRSITLDIFSTSNNESWTLKLFRNFNNQDTLVATFNLSVADTSIIDDNNGKGLILDTEYRYYTIITDSEGILQDSSSYPAVRTLKATTHNYTWEKHFITAPPGILLQQVRDIWGTDDYNVWVVGTVLIGDTAYGVLKWDGTEWRGESKKGGYEAIYGFSDKDIWMVGTSVQHYDGINLTAVDPQDPVLSDNRSYTSLWGTSSKDLYFGSFRGKIVHWDGNRGRVVYEKEGYYVNDIYGSSSNNVFAVLAKPLDLYVMHYDGNSWTEVNSIPNSRLYPTSVMSFSEKENFISGQSIMFGAGENWDIVASSSYGGAGRIRGSQTNNIFAVGSIVFHYNGFDWHEYEELRNSRLEGVYVTSSKVYIAGTADNSKSAMLLIGTKQE